MTETTNEPLICPHCGKGLPALQWIDGPDEDSAPAPGAVNLCTFCGETGVFNDDLRLRKPTETELEEFELDEGYQVHRVRARRMAREYWRTRSHPEGETEEGDEGLGVVAIEIGISENGLEFPEEMPTDLRNMLGPVLRDIRVQLMGEEIKTHVTAEVANHVLSAYGNEMASMPSVAMGALISLIRLCNEMDDHLMSQLNDTEGIHGYVLAVTMLAESGPAGMEMLEMLAGLRDPRDGSTK